MTREERTKLIKKLSKKYYVEDAYGYTDETIVNKVNEIIDVVNKLSSVTPTRSTGRWIEKEDYNLDTYYECSECGEDYCIEGDILIHKYCPNCGAKMDGVETEEEDE